MSPCQTIGVWACGLDLQSALSDISCERVVSPVLKTNTCTTTTAPSYQGVQTHFAAAAGLHTPGSKTERDFVAGAPGTSPTVPDVGADSHLRARRCNRGDLLWRCCVPLLSRCLHSIMPGSPRKEDVNRARRDRSGTRVLGADPGSEVGQRNVGELSAFGERCVFRVTPSTPPDRVARVCKAQQRVCSARSPSLPCLPQWLPCCCGSGRGWVGATHTLTR